MRRLTLFILATAPALALGAVGRLAAGPRGLALGVVAGVALALVAYWRADSSLLRVFRAREISQSAPKLKLTTEKIAAVAGVPCPRLYLAPSKSPNAFAVGRSASHCAVVVTEGLLESLTPEEVEGVIGHEIAHIANNDTLINTLTATCAGAIGAFAGRARFAALAGGKLAASSRSAVLLAGFVAPVAATLVQLAVSRSREFAADRQGAGYANRHLELASALKKIDRSPVRIDHDRLPHTAHLFVYSSFNRRFISALFSTHPPVEERVRRLEGLAKSGGGLSESKVA